LNSFQEIVARDLPGINLVSVRQSTVFNRPVVDVTTGATGISSNFAKVYLTKV
jgi:peptide/nickel transport system substrate-binding protein